MPALATLDDHPDDPVPSGAEVGTLAAADGVALRWARFAPLGRLCRGTVLILQGRAEFVERWFETIRDLQVRGFRVVAFDWRGQGGSQRMASHPRMGHVRDFRAYRRDLDAILAEVVPPPPEPLYVLAHSTGALIAAEAAPDLRGRVRRMVMVAPFLGLGDFGLSEGLARPLARLLRGLGLGRTFVPGGGATAILTTPFETNRLTSDPRRHARGAERSWRRPDLAIGSPSIGWLAAAFAAQTRVMRPEALDAWRIPTLILAAGADAVVSLPAIERFAAATRATGLLVVPGARHELLQERDRWREQAWAAFDAFVPGDGA
ncbi:MAG: alpha/beta hydrolase, partial [Phyllobacteriaceae bacterium]|nr:alpha/beta hydrolase [Phyllobacteriaceae bacterium]